MPCAELAPQVTEGFLVNLLHQAEDSTRTPPPSDDGSPRTERSPLPCGHLPTPWGVTPSGEAIFIPAPFCVYGFPLGELAPQVTEGYFRVT